MFYSYFSALGYEITVESRAAHARLDMTMRTGGHIYLSEFQGDRDGGPQGSGFTQSQERDYRAKAAPATTRSA